MGTRGVGRWLRRLLVALAVTAALAAAQEASAQIWVVTEADGTQRFTTRPEPGARVYVRTRHSPGAMSSSRTVIGRFGEEIAGAAGRTGLDASLIRAVIAAESNFDPQAVSHRGAQGLMQLMPATARELGVDDVFAPYDNILGGSRHLARLVRKYDDLDLALAAYNAGEGAVQRYGGVPPFRETRNYVRRVLGFYDRYRSVESG